MTFILSSVYFKVLVGPTENGRHFDVSLVSWIFVFGSVSPNAGGFMSSSSPWNVRAWLPALGCFMGPGISYAMGFYGIVMRSLCLTWCPPRVSAPVRVWVLLLWSWISNFSLIVQDGPWGLRVCHFPIRGLVFQLEICVWSLSSAVFVGLFRWVLPAL